MQARSRSLIPFFLLSSGLHVLLLLAWPHSAPELEEPVTPPIAVTLLRPRKEEKPPTAQESYRPEPLRPVPARPKEPPSPIADRPSSVMEPDPEAVTKSEKAARPLREARARDEIPIGRRTLPTLKELLPPVTWSRSAPRTGEEEALPLNSRDSRHVSYLASVKRAIELVWEYPEAALRRGIEGTLVLDFTIASNGSLTGISLVRSSGSTVLDEEAVRAVHAAAPFHPLPLWVGKSRLRITATLEYHDHRVQYSLTP